MCQISDTCHSFIWHESDICHLSSTCPIPCLLHVRQHACCIRSPNHTQGARQCAMEFGGLGTVPNSFRALQSDTPSTLSDIRSLARRPCLSSKRSSRSQLRLWLQRFRQTKASPGMSLENKMDHFRKNQDMSTFNQADLRL
eukprot:8042631-Alexandrium_andersonii.AAC.1